jgi:hypothetical protein
VTTGLQRPILVTILIAPGPWDVKDLVVRSPLLGGFAMPISEEARLTALLWRAAMDSESPLGQDEIDGILGLERRPVVPYIPEQSIDGDADSWLRIRTDAGDERWLAHLVDHQCWELL